MTVRELWSAIRNKCMYCTNHQPKEIRLCRVYDCPTWPYRMGKNHPVQVPEQADLLKIMTSEKPKTGETFPMKVLPQAS